ncbi:MAG: sugar ABC transporter permease [Clostridiales bacterium]|nr:sugar ABC transporter permease [Bacillota bacterium]NLL55486.1 sugar ABC transporter permease [Clostridiales bacterium]
MDQYYSNKRIVLLFLLPALVIYVGLAVYPIVQSIVFSFYEWNGLQGVPMEYVGMNNFGSMFRSAKFWLSVKNVLQFIAVNLIFQIIIGYGLAVLLAQNRPGFKIFKTIFFFPVVLPLTATALLWKFIYFPNNIGVLNQLLNAIGLESLKTGWLINTKTALNAVSIANVWTGFGYHMVIGFAALSAIPDGIMESSMIDGATGFRQFFSITLPMIWESMKISFVLLITGSMKNFDIIFVMTEGGPNGATHVPSTLMYYEAFKYDHYGLGSAISVFIFVASLALAGLTIRLMRRESVEY